MKNAAAYATKLKALLTGLKKRYPPSPSPEPDPTGLEVLAVSVLRYNASREQAERALRALKEEFVDFNEMRVAPPKDIADLLGGDMPLGRTKADALVGALERLFEHGKALSLEYLAEMGKRELRVHLRESLGLSEFSEGYLTLYHFGGHAIPVDGRMLERLRAEQAVPPNADADEVRALLERTVPAKDSADVYEALSRYAAERHKTRPAATPARRHVAGKGKTKAGAKRAKSKPTTKKPARKAGR